MTLIASKPAVLRPQSTVVPPPSPDEPQSGLGICTGSADAQARMVLPLVLAKLTSKWVRPAGTVKRKSFSSSGRFDCPVNTSGASGESVPV